MSRIGNKPIPIPDKVKVNLAGQIVQVEGPKGKLAWTPRPEISVEVDGSAKMVIVRRGDDERLSKSLHGLTRSLIANMVEGCLNGYEKKMELYGVGYGATSAGGKLTLTCGFSHTVVFDVPAGVVVTIQTPQARGDSEPAKFTVSGPDKHEVGQFAARVYQVRPPEPYKGKGVRYSGQRVRRKVGKAFAGAGGG